MVLDVQNIVTRQKINYIKSQYKMDWCKNIKHLPFDFVLSERKIIIELDGPQHFRQVSNGKHQSITEKETFIK